MWFGGGSIWPFANSKLLGMTNKPVLIEYKMWYSNSILSKDILDVFAAFPHCWKPMEYFSELLFAYIPARQLCSSSDDYILNIPATRTTYGHRIFSYFVLCTLSVLFILLPFLCYPFLILVLGAKIMLLTRVSIHYTNPSFIIIASHRCWFWTDI